MYIKQKQLENLKNSLELNKVIVIYGARRTGKTTLIQKLLEDEKGGYLLVNGEDIFVQQNLSSQSVEKLKGFVGDNRLLVIDEAQKINNIGLNLKLIVDNIKDIKVIATGSSSFDLAHQIGEPLTGRKYTLKLFPLAQLELASIENVTQTESRLESRLIYGSYPEVILSEDETIKQRYLKEIVSSYLYKDILELDGLRHSDKIVRLLQLLAFQIGKEVSFNELGTQLGISKNTVDKYLELLEKAFVIFKLKGFSRNLRKELVKNNRYFFFDTGIRNALINNFNGLTVRDDIGMLWENYVITERLKQQEYCKIYSNNYFWRTYDRKEIDFVEEREGRIYGYEIKWQKQKAKPPNDFIDTYKGAEFQVITKENYLEFIV